MLIFNGYLQISVCIIGFAMYCGHGLTDSRNGIIPGTAREDASINRVGA